MRSMKLSSVVLACALAVTGCYGPFRLTKKLHKWNGEVGDRWVNEGVFVLMVVVPVYAFSSLADAIVFNSIEFWSGNNPIASKPKVLKDGDKSAVLHYDETTRRLRVDNFVKGKAVSTVVVAPENGDMTARDGEGRLLARSQPGGEEIRVVDGEGRRLSAN